MTRSDTNLCQYSEVIKGVVVSQITSPTNVYSTVYSAADQTKQQSSASLAFLRGIHRWPMNSPHKWPVTRKMFPFDVVIILIPAKRHRPPRLSYWQGNDPEVVTSRLWKRLNAEGASVCANDLRYLLYLINYTDKNLYLSEMYCLICLKQ